ncbi:MAG: hypothetical protein ACYDDA_10800 [Acidiferrobacteraceae bacterium]
MTLRYADRVQESVTAPSGSAAFAISATAAWTSGYQSFANIPNIAAGDTVYYCGVDATGNAEIGIGTYGSGSLTRTTILSSSNANAAVTFSGTVTLFCSLPAEALYSLNGGEGDGFPVPGNTLWPRYMFNWTSYAGYISEPMVAVPFFLSRAATPKYLSITVLSYTSGPISLRLGMYTDNGAGLPGTLVPNSDTGTLSVPEIAPTPVLSAVAGGTLAATTYYAKITYVSATGQSLPSAEASLAVAADNVLSIASPAAITGATGWNAYVSTATGTETLQNTSSIAIGTAWQEPTTGLTTTGAGVPTSMAITGALTGVTELPPGLYWLTQLWSANPANSSFNVLWNNPLNGVAQQFCWPFGNGYIPSSIPSGTYASNSMAAVSAASPAFGALPATFPSPTRSSAVTEDQIVVFITF